MPNWVDNFVSIGGTPEDVEAFIKKISAPRPEQKTIKEGEDKYPKNVEGEWFIPETTDRGDFSFWNLIAPPEDKWHLYFSTSGWADGKRLGDTEWNWYNWNSENWGCKWDAGVEDFQEYGDGSISYIIKTPWDTPRPIWNALAVQHPELHIEVRFEEEQGWGGIIEISGGDAVMVEEWDIPTSHDEWVEHFDECRMCNWGEPELEFGCPAVEETNA